MGEIAQGLENGQQARKRILECEQARQRERKRHDQIIASINASSRAQHRRVLDSLAVQNGLLAFLLCVVIANLVLDAYLHVTQ